MKTETHETVGDQGFHDFDGGFGSIPIVISIIKHKKSLRNSLYFLNYNDLEIVLNWISSILFSEPFPECRIDPEKEQQVETDKCPQIDKRIQKRVLI